MFINRNRDIEIMRYSKIDIENACEIILSVGRVVWAVLMIFSIVGLL